MALTERLRIVVDAATGGAVREFEKVEKKTRALGDETGRSASKLDKFAGSIGVTSAGLKAGLAAGALAAGAALVRFGASAVTAASNLEEANAATGEIFGEGADKIREFADSASTNLGLSERAALQASNAFGDLFANLGFEDADAAQFSEAFTRLAADLASFKNQNPEEVLQKLRSGLSGESEPLKSLGIIINDTAVKAKAMELGLADANGQISEQAKVAARAALILEKSRNAQGDLVRTSESLANQQRELNAQIEDFQANVGGLLTPAVAGALSPMNDLLGAVTSLTDALPDGGDTVSNLASDYFSLFNPLTALNKIREKGNALLQELGVVGKDAEKTVYDYASAEEALAEAARTGNAQLRSQAIVAQASESSLLDLAGGAKTAAERMDDFRSATFSVIDAQLGLERSQRDVADAQRELADRRGDLNRLLREGIVDTEAVAAAQERLEQATRSVADAEERVAEVRRRIAELERPDPLDEEAAAIALERAIDRVGDAERRRADILAEPAKKIAQAEKELLDLTAKLALGGFTEAENAQIAEAEAELNELRRTAKVDTEALEDAELDLRQARLELTREQERGTDVERELARAADDLADAERDVADAQKQAEKAAKDLADAQKGDPDRLRLIEDATRAVADAERGVADAQYAVIDAQAQFGSALAAQKEVLGGSAREAALLRNELHQIAAIYPHLAPLLAGLAGSPIAQRGGLAGIDIPSIGSGGVIPGFHGGGVYKAPPGQTEGLALLRHGEHVFTPEQMRQGGGTTVVVQNLNVTASDPDDLVRKLKRWADSNGPIPVRTSG